MYFYQERVVRNYWEVTTIKKNHSAKLLITIIFFWAIIIFPQNAAAENVWSEAGLGVGSVLISILYSPAKVTYAILGSITGGVAYVVSGFSKETADRIWVASLRGDYIITPAILQGDKAVRFVGMPRMDEQ